MVAEGGDGEMVVVYVRICMREKRGGFRERKRQ